MAGCGIRAVYFDMDGVLTTDSMGSYTTCSYISRETGIPVEKVIAGYSCIKSVTHLGTGTAGEVWPDFCRMIGKEVDISVLRDAFSSTPVDPEMLEIVSALKNGNYKTGMITNNSVERMGIISSKYGFDSLFTAMTVSGSVGCKKPDAEIYRKALGSLGLSPCEAVFIDNQENNLVTPNVMGFVTILFDRTKQRPCELAGRLASAGVALRYKSFPVIS